MAHWLDSDPLLPARTPSSMLSSRRAQITQPDNFFQLPTSRATQQDKDFLSQLLREGLADIKKLQDPLYSALREYQEADEDWAARLTSYAPVPDQFQAGGLHANVACLEEFFTLTGNNSVNAKKVISWIKQGIKLPFVGVNHKSHQHAPEYRKKLEIVKRMLAKAKGSEHVEECLQGREPSQVQFPNPKSAEVYASFVDTEVAKALQKKVVVEWPFQDLPRVICGLKVVDDKPKLRLCINPMYPNVFMEHWPVKYERLLDLVDLLGSGDYMSTSDDKSGYWQLPLHPDMWQYVAFEWRDKIYVWTVPAFGLSVVPYIYSTVKQELFRPLRDMGVRMAFLIDDR